jgi:hypothetical protein
VIQADGGTVNMTAVGDGITLRSGSRILAQGTAEAPGGRVGLQADSGIIGIESAAVVDVSAGNQGDAGLVSLQAPRGGISILGELNGRARGGSGGTLFVDTYQVSNTDATRLNTDMSQLLGTIEAGGFTESVAIRARTGNIDIASGMNMQARRVKLIADDMSYGQINIAGQVRAAEGGSVELYARNDLNILSGGMVRAASASIGSLDPDVLMSSSQGSININGTIDVSGAAGNAGGTIYLRTQRNQANDDLNASLGTQGSIVGASAVYAEAFKQHDISSTQDPALAAKIGEAAAFYANTMNNANRFGSGIDSFHLLPGIELSSTGDIQWNTAWDATGTRFGEEPGVLTIRARGNLNINRNLKDAPSGYDITSVPAGRNSWGMNLVAGADLQSADSLAGDSAGAGNLILANNVAVYTESAPVRFASAGDTILGTTDYFSNNYLISTSMNYNLASFSGSIKGYVGRDLTVGGAIQTATGDIDISVGRDLNLRADSTLISPGAGAIRTTGRLSLDAAADAMGTHSLDPVLMDSITGRPFASTRVTQFDAEWLPYMWRYTDGGDISLSAGRRVGQVNNLGQWVAADTGAWDYFSQIYVTIDSSEARYGLFSANYVYGTAGLATMGGGNLSARTGGDFLAQAGTFGAGDLAVHSGGDIKGRFLNKEGNGEIHAMGNVGAYNSSALKNERTQIELFHGTMNVTARGEIQLGAVVNPTLASDKSEDYRGSDFVHSDYRPATGISLGAGTDVTLAGRSPYYSNPAAALPNERVLPANVHVTAGGSLHLLNDIALASSPKGNLSIRAQGDVIGKVETGSGGFRPAQILVSDLAPENWYGLFYVFNNSEQRGNWITARTATNRHGLYHPLDQTMSVPQDGPLHQGDKTAVVIDAGRDVQNLNILFPKMAEITAGRDIVDITYDGQNIDPGDVSLIRAGREITMKYARASESAANGGPVRGLIQGGPGVFLVQAGGSLDLGSLSGGIQEVGAGNNLGLTTGKSSLIVLSGYDKNMSADEVRTFFDQLRDSGDLYSMLLAGGKREDAEKLVKRITTGAAKDAVAGLLDKAGNENELYAMLTSGGNREDADRLLEDTRKRTVGILMTSGSGDINMTSSQISTSNAASDVFIIAGGNLNLGKTSLPSANEVNTATGITTANGGAINIFALKDINVQESRVMTFFSRQDMVDDAVAYGDIAIWSNQGNINAGRGSRTAVNASPPKLMPDPSGAPGVLRLVFTPPAVGSGIRAMTYGDNPPTPGEIHLFAPSGIIDAGEAGIAGGRITLAALQVNNAANINFSAGSIGMPQASEAGASSLGTLAGSGNAAQNTQLTADTSSLSAAKMQAAQMVEDIIAKWLEVKVIDFVEDEEDRKKEE